MDIRKQHNVGMYAEYLEDLVSNASSEGIGMVDIPIVLAAYLKDICEEAKKREEKRKDYENKSMICFGTDGENKQCESCKHYVFKEEQKPEISPRCFYCGDTLIDCKTCKYDACSFVSRKHIYDILTKAGLKCAVVPESNDFIKWMDTHIEEAYSQLNKQKENIVSCEKLKKLRKVLSDLGVARIQYQDINECINEAVTILISLYRHGENHHICEATPDRWKKLWSKMREHGVKLEGRRHINFYLDELFKYLDSVKGLKAENEGLKKKNQDLKEKVHVFESNSTCKTILRGVPRCFGDYCESRHVILGTCNECCLKECKEETERRENEKSKVLQEERAGSDEESRVSSDKE